MKRIAALAALVISMVAVPAAALASTGAGTGGSGPGYERPGPVPIACPPGFREGQVSRHVTTHRIRHGKPFSVRIVCLSPYLKACRYDGGSYTIVRVNPGAGSFTVFVNGCLFRNSATVPAAAG